MLRDKLNQALQDQEQSVKEVILKVLSIEQQHISMRNPHVKNEIDQVIDTVAKRILEQEAQ